jgi:2-desacetyl-2-hydroxyethyl bacteriochlorophyllide A dehydrogenase
MQSLVIDKVGHNEFRAVDEMPLNAGEVLLDVHFVGLCGSDLNTFNGLNPLVELPRVPGHEIGGSIAAVGENVSDEFTQGRNAIVIPYTTCGVCPPCRKGRVNACQFNKTLGVQQDGGLRRQIVLKEDRLILNDTLAPHHLALVEPLSVGFHAVARGHVAASETVLVIGGGMIGIGAILGAKAAGARVIASEVSASKAETLKKMGVDATINPENEDLAARLLDLTDGAGPDVIIEAVGLPETFRAAIDLAPFSGRVVYIGYAKTEVSYDTTLFNLKELDIRGSRNATRTDFEDVVRHLEGHPDLADQLITKVFAWPDADQALGYWNAHRHETFKIMIDMGANHEPK